MRNSNLIFVIAILLAGTTYGYNGYNEAHGPFDDNFDAPRLDLHEIPGESIPAGTNSNTAEILFSTNQPVRTQIRVSCDSRGKFVEISEGGRVVLAKTAFSDFDTVGSCFTHAYTADLNMDGRRDFIIYSFSGGCGLASGYCNVAFVLSDSNNTYRLTTIQTLFPDSCEYIVLNGAPCFVQTSFNGEGKCNDGKWHNFWIYNLLAFEGGNVRLRNDVYPGFPKIIWYSLRPNHKETDLLSPAQKGKLEKDALKEIFWKYKTTRPRSALDY